MNTKKAFFDLTGLIMVMVIISLMLLLLLTKNLFSVKPHFDKSSKHSTFSEEISPSEYKSIMKQTERTVDSFKSQISRQQKQLDY